MNKLIVWLVAMLLLVKAMDMHPLKGSEEGCSRPKRLGLDSDLQEYIECVRNNPRYGKRSFDNLGGGRLRPGYYKLDNKVYYQAPGNGNFPLWLLYDGTI